MSPNETAAASYQDALHVISLRSECQTFNNLRSGLFLPSAISEVWALGSSKVEVKTPAKEHTFCCPVRLPFQIEKDAIMRVSMIGAGYVGLTTGVCLAEMGHDVICADIDKNRIANLNEGSTPFMENGLAEMMQRNVAAGRLAFTDDLNQAVAEREIVMIAVGTPKGAEGEADLSFVREAARRIAPLMAPKTVVTLKSTVVVGTAKEVREIIAEERGALDFWVTSNPEFLREGSAISDFLYPDRIVIGADDRDAAERLIELYRPLLKRDVPLVETGTANAELIKYAANAFLALKIGFINDV